MGAEASVEIAKPFVDVSKCKVDSNVGLSHALTSRLRVTRGAGSRSRLDSVIQGYSDGEYDFGIDLAALKSITGYDNDEAKELQQVLVKNENTGMYVLILLIFCANK